MGPRGTTVWYLPVLCRTHLQRVDAGGQVAGKVPTLHKVDICSDGDEGLPETETLQDIQGRGGGGGEGGGGGGGGGEG